MTAETQQERILGWDGCLNVRDLGGYRTTNGDETVWGAFVRSDDMSTLTEDGRQALQDYGVRTIIDLRLPRELRQYPNPFADGGDHGIAYHNISFVDPAATPASEFNGLANDYLHMLDRFKPSVARVLQTIAAAPPGGLVFHCMGGKDRTGLIAALLLSLVGVPRDVIGADYALTAECLRPRDEAWLENGPGSRADRERELATHVPTAEVMQEVLDELDAQYGGVEQYVLVTGVTGDEIRRIQNRLLGRAGATGT